MDNFQSHYSNAGPEWPCQSDGPKKNSADPKWIERRRDVWVRKAKRYFLQLLIDGAVTSTDDVRKLVPIYDGIHPSLVGSVPTDFHRDGLIERVGDFHTERPVAHGRFLSLWRIKDIEAARKWLESHPDLRAEESESRHRSADPQKQLPFELEGGAV